MKLNNNLSTTSNLWEAKEEEVLEYLTTLNSPKDQFETILFLPRNIIRKGEGGLRIKGFYKRVTMKKPVEA